MSVPVAGKYYTLAEYHHLGDSGVLGEDDRVELIEGEIVAMAAIKGPHMLGLNRCTRALTRIPDQPWIVSVQNPIHLFGDTEPQPDIAVLRPEADRAAVPEAADVHLIIEVSDTTLSYDLGRKRRLYARAGIVEYWVMDINGRCILRHTRPDGDVYRQVDQFEPGDTIDSLVLPVIRLWVAALFA